MLALMTMTSPSWWPMSLSNSTTSLSQRAYPRGTSNQSEATVSSLAGAKQPMVEDLQVDFFGHSSRFSIEAFAEGSYVGIPSLVRYLQKISSLISIKIIWSAAAVLAQIRVREIVEDLSFVLWDITAGKIRYEVRKKMKVMKSKIQYVLVGVTSWGIGCGKTPGIYAEVADYLDWINEITAQYP